MQQCPSFYKFKVRDAIAPWETPHTGESGASGGESEGPSTGPSHGSKRALTPLGYRLDRPAGRDQRGKPRGRRGVPSAMDAAAAAGDRSDSSSSSSSDSVLIPMPLDQRHRKKLQAQLQREQEQQRGRERERDRKIAAPKVALAVGGFVGRKQIC